MDGPNNRESLLAMQDIHCVKFRQAGTCAQGPEDIHLMEAGAHCWESLEVFIEFVGELKVLFIKLLLTESDSQAIED